MYKNGSVSRTASILTQLMSEGTAIYGFDSMTNIIAKMVKAAKVGILS